MPHNTASDWMEGSVPSAQPILRDSTATTSAGEIVTAPVLRLQAATAATAMAPTTRTLLRCCSGVPASAGG